MDEELSKGPDSTIRRSPSDSDYYILDEVLNAPSPVIDLARSSWNVSVSTGSRAVLHCTIDNAERKTVSNCLVTATKVVSSLPNNLTYLDPTYPGLRSPGSD